MKNKFSIPATQIYQEFKVVMQSMASTTDQLKPFDFDALVQKVVAYHQDVGRFSRSFYSVVDMQLGDFSWQYGIGAALGIPKDPTLGEFLGYVHPDYLPMFRFWAMAINEAAYSIDFGEQIGDYVYHISLPLRRFDGSFYWYTQHSFAMQHDAAGHYINHFNFYDYGGLWYPRNRPPFLPYVTKLNKPAPDLDGMMYAIAAPRIRALFTHTEQLLLEWYMKGEPVNDKLRMQPHTLHEHNSNILKKTTSILLTDFKSAREAAALLLESRLWQISG